MSYAVDAGLESSPVADVATEPARDAAATVGWVHRILDEERGITIASPALEQVR